MTKADQDHSMDVDKSSEEGDRKRRRLRSAEADLKVIVGNEKEGFKVYWCYSQVLATQSRYVDTLLSTPLPTNNDKNPSRDHKEITFPDITPSQWERMMRFLANTTYMSIEDAMELVQIFDKYEFPTGIKICDDVLLKKVILKEEWRYRVPFLFQQTPDPRQIDQVVDTIALSHIMNLPKTFSWGRGWLVEALKIKSLTELGYFPLTAVHIRRLVPAIIRDTELLKLRQLSDVQKDLGMFDSDGNEIDADIVDTAHQIAEYLDDGGDEFGVGIESFLKHCFVFDHDIKSPLYADLLLATLQLKYLSYVATQNIERIKIVFPSRAHGLAGNYKRGSEGAYAHWTHETDDTLWLYKCERTRQWVLGVRFGVHPLFVCRYPQFSLIPPKTGWVETDHNGPKIGEVPTIEY